MLIHFYILIFLKFFINLNLCSDVDWGGFEALIKQFNADFVKYKRFDINVSIIWSWNISRVYKIIRSEDDLRLFLEQEDVEMFYPSLFTVGVSALFTQSASWASSYHRGGE